ncbi:MAG: Glycine--tRNA ligase beta subunit [Firmicutes bacterium ADurb.Bin456]|nr:MAG: Glycine--tRNA ligase beta subunit [Firmicutes bacterium ADurb.Bin456]
MLVDDSERELYRKLTRVQEQAGVLLEQQNYQTLLGAIATLQQPLDIFFNSVMVMVEDERLRANRLALLAELAALVQRVADLSIIAGVSK